MKLTNIDGGHRPRMWQECGGSVEKERKKKEKTVGKWLIVESLT